MRYLKLKIRSYHSLMSWREGIKIFNLTFFIWEEILFEMIKPVRDSKFLFPPKDILSDLHQQPMHKFESADSKFLYYYYYDYLKDIRKEKKKKWGVLSWTSFCDVTWGTRYPKLGALAVFVSVPCGQKHNSSAVTDPTNHLLICISFHS